MNQVEKYDQVVEILHEGIYYRKAGDGRNLILPGTTPADKGLLKRIGTSLQGSVLVIDKKAMRVVYNLAFVVRNDKKRKVWNTTFQNLKGVQLSKSGMKPKLTFITRDGNTQSFYIPLLSVKQVRQYLDDNDIVKMGKQSKKVDSPDHRWLDKK